MYFHPTDQLTFLTDAVITGLLSDHVETSVTKIPSFICPHAPTSFSPVGAAVTQNVRSSPSTSVANEASFMLFSQPFKTRSSRQTTVADFQKLEVMSFTEKTYENSHHKSKKTIPAQCKECHGNLLH